MSTAQSTDRPLLLGAKAAPNSYPIWNTIRNYFHQNGLPVEYVLYSTYDAMRDGLFRGDLDIAWNAPMAHAQSLIQSDGACRTLAMRDVDDDCHTLVIARADAGIGSLDDLRGRRFALGSDSSSELYWLPLQDLRAAGFDPTTDAELVALDPRDYRDGTAAVDDRVLFDAVVGGKVDAAVLFQPALAPLLERSGMDATDIAVVWQGESFDHCAFTARPTLEPAVADRFVQLLLAMDPADPEIAEMMRLENLTRWLPADAAGWDSLVGALSEAEPARA